MVRMLTQFTLAVARPHYLSRHYSSASYALYANFKIATGPEITLEINPGSATPEKLARFEFGN